MTNYSSIDPAVISGLRQKGSVRELGKAPATYAEVEKLILPTEVAVIQHRTLSRSRDKAFHLANPDNYETILRAFPSIPVLLAVVKGVEAFTVET